MDRFLRPERFDATPNATGSDKAWLHWKRTFSSFLTSVTLTHKDINKLDILVNYVSPTVFEYISECETFDTAMNTLQTLFIAPKNEIFARHILATRLQQPGETLIEFLNTLKLLAKDCQFKSVTAEIYRQELIRDAFINGIQAQHIRQRLLENTTLTLDAAFTQARSLELAQKSSESYNQIPLNAVSKIEHKPSIEDEPDQSVIAASKGKKCFFCGYNYHNRQQCPAKEATCNNCGKTGHFSKVCQSKKPSNTSASIFPTLAAVVSSTKYPSCLQKTILPIEINNHTAQALIDTGSSSSFICSQLTKKLCLEINHTTSTVSMAESSISVNVIGYVNVTIRLKDNCYENTKLSVLENLCTEVILGQDILSLHKSLIVEFGGAKPPLSVCGLTTISTTPPSLFANLKPNCKPIATKSRRYTQSDRKFIDNEIQRLLKEDVIEPSTSPWRAQVIVTSDERHKRRMVVDYSRTVNLYTELDAYPLPRISDQVNEIAKYSVFSTIDLKDAYYQIPLKDQDKPYTAFEASGGLWQFKRMPFGVTNGVPCFQRNIDNFITKHNLPATFAYLDNITIGGKDEKEHDTNLNKFLAAAEADNLKFNEDKCTFKTTSVQLLGYLISNNEIRPDPSRLQPLRNLPAPKNLTLQKKAIGLFAYYSKWIKNFSEKFKPLANNTTFPLPQSVLAAFEVLKKDIENSVIVTIDETKPFVVETDASDFAIAATLNQDGRPVAFFSRILQKSELNHPSVEKEAYSIVESIRYWKHYLTGRHFTLITDQKSVRYMFDGKRSGKIKNDKIERWRIELACFTFDIKYRPGAENIPADTFSRLFCNTVSNDKLSQLHDSLCHPGLTRMNHYVKMKNIPASIDELKSIITNCRTCAECKPRFHRPNESNLIKATQPFERLSVDFKGPLPSVNSNKYILTVVDEYSRFPFAIPCSDLSSKTVISSLCSILSVFGNPDYVHSDRGQSFMSTELKNWLYSKNIATSRTTPYNPKGNGQCERYNATIWKAVTLALRSRNLDSKYWETVLPDALHSIRSLLCTATNMTPHERLFSYSRRSTNGLSMPSWLSNPGPVLLKRHVRNSKYEPLVDEVELLEANPNYAHIRHPDGRENTVSLRDLAPCGAPLSPVQVQPTLPTEPAEPIQSETELTEVVTHNDDPTPCPSPIQTQTPEDVKLRRSKRERRKPERLDL